jgi:ATP-dependent Lon protease
VILPARNKRDLEDIPESVRKDLTFVWLDRVEDAVNSAIEATAPVKAA